MKRQNVIIMIYPDKEPICQTKKQNKMSNIANIEVIQSYLILADSKAEKQTSVNTSKSRLNKNRIAAKNEKIQNVICSQIDNQIISIKKLEYRQQRKADRQAKRK